MYLSHYSLNKMPFSISPDPSLLWLGEKHSEALATLKYGIYENIGFLVLTGNIGTGKTALINRMATSQDLEVDLNSAGIEVVDILEEPGFLIGIGKNTK